MSLKMKCHSKRNVPQNEMLPRMECHLNGILFAMEGNLMKCHSKWNSTPNGMSIKIECNSK